MTSNLGGLGGPLTATQTTPPVIRISSVATMEDGTVVDLEIRNLTNYAAANPRLNTVRRRTLGSFGGVNLLASAHGSGADLAWTSLRFTFLNAQTSQPVLLGRTYISFYDFDLSASSRECLQVKGASSYRLSSDTAISEGAAGIGGFPSLPVSDPWATPIFCATLSGTNADNPQDPRGLDDVQRPRAVMFVFDDASSFDVRISIDGCCGGGRNFLFAGRSAIQPSFPLCSR